MDPARAGPSARLVAGFYGVHDDAMDCGILWARPGHVPGVRLQPAVLHDRGSLHVVRVAQLLCCLRAWSSTPAFGTQKPLTELPAAPATVTRPDRPPRYLSLQEAIAIALERGTASTRTLQGAHRAGLEHFRPGLPMVAAAGQRLRGGTASLTSQTDAIRVISLNPALAGTDIEVAQARFDANWITSLNYTTTDQLLQGLNSFSNGNVANFSSSIVKMLASGGFVSTTFQQNYQLLQAPPTGAFTILNPLYSNSLTFGFEQPLWRNYGVRINQLLSGTPSPTTGFGIPGAVVNQYSQRAGALQQGGQFGIEDGILIARLRFDQNRADFERVVQGLVLQVEVAYWNLYNSYGQLYSFEESLRIAHRAWMIAYAKLQAGAGGVADYAPVRGQYEDFRTQRVTALGLVLESERNLRLILGLPVEDGCRIVPVTPPSLAHYLPDWTASARDTLMLRPELLLARDNLRLAQYNLEVAENFMKPDVRFAAQYVPLGFGTALGGNGQFIDGTGTPQPSGSLESLRSDRFNNWQVGLTMNVPLGFRLESAQRPHAHSHQPGPELLPCEGSRAEGDGRAGKAIREAAGVVQPHSGRACLPQSLRRVGGRAAQVHHCRQDLARCRLPRLPGQAGDGPGDGVRGHR